MNKSTPQCLIMLSLYLVICYFFPFQHAPSGIPLHRKLSPGTSPDLLRTHGRGHHQVRFPSHPRPLLLRSRAQPALLGV